VNGSLACTPNSNNQNGFVPSREEKGRLLKKYWTVTGRKIETSVVLPTLKNPHPFFPIDPF
jgi:hypothetical protein